LEPDEPGTRYGHQAAPPNCPTPIVNWYTDPIVADIRAVRRLATHHHYVKTQAGPRILERPLTGGTTGLCATSGPTERLPSHISVVSIDSY